MLTTCWREQELGRGRRAPRHAILDSQSVKSAAEGEARGFHGGKQIKGRWRHMAVASQGTLLAVHVTAANASDSSQAGTVMAQASERVASLESFTADQGYQRQAEHAARETLRRGAACHRQTEHTKKGFPPGAFRWRVERTFAWLGQCHLLSKEYEKTVRSAQAWLWCAMMRLLIRRLA